MKFSMQIWLKSGEHITSMISENINTDTMSLHADQLRDGWGDLVALTIVLESGDIVLIPKENIETITFLKEE